MGTWPIKPRRDNVALLEKSGFMCIFIYDVLFIYGVFSSKVKKITFVLTARNQTTFDLLEECTYIFEGGGVAWFSESRIRVSGCISCVQVIYLECGSTEEWESEGGGKVIATMYGWSKKPRKALDSAMDFEKN